MSQISHNRDFRLAKIAQVLSLCSVVALAACGGEHKPADISGNPLGHTYTVGGKLDASAPDGLVLQQNGGEKITVSAGSRDFTFKTPLADKAKYRVTVKAQPLGYACDVTNGAGLINKHNVTDVIVKCSASTNKHNIGGRLNGPAPEGLVLQNDNNEVLAVPHNSRTFAFDNQLNLQDYDVKVRTQPTGYNCTVANGTGTFVSKEIQNIFVSCVTPPDAMHYSIGGRLNVGAPAGVKLGLEITTVPGDMATMPSQLELMPGDTRFTFPIAAPDGGHYKVSVASAPAGYHCLLARDEGDISGNNIDDVGLTCTKVAGEPVTVELHINDFASTNSGNFTGMYLAIHHELDATDPNTAEKPQLIELPQTADSTIRLSDTAELNKTLTMSLTDANGKPLDGAPVGGDTFTCEFEGPVATYDVSDSGDTVTSKSPITSTVTNIKILCATAPLP